MSSKLTCKDCETFKAWEDALQWLDERLITLPESGSIVPDNYAYCETCGAVVDLDETPENNRCTEFVCWWRE